MSSVTRKIRTMATNSATKKTRKTARIYAMRKSRRTATSSATRKIRTMGIESCFVTGSAASTTATNSASRVYYLMEQT